MRGEAVSELQRSERRRVGRFAFVRRRFGAVRSATQGARCATRNTEFGRWCCLLPDTGSGAFEHSVHAGRCFWVSSFFIAPRFSSQEILKARRGCRNEMRLLQAVSDQNGA
jgi:hypothetical protein